MILPVFALIFSIAIINVLINILIGRLHKHPYWFWMSTTLLFVALMILFIGLWGLFAYAAFTGLISFFAFLAAASSLIAQRKLLKSLRRLEVGTPQEEKALLSNSVLYLKGHADTTSTLLTKSQEILGIETVRNCLAEHADDHIIFRGCKMEDGKLNMNVITANLNKLKNEERPRAVFLAFSDLNLACLEMLSTVTSSKIAHEVFLDAIAENMKSHEIVYVQELPALLFMGVLEPVLVKCKKSIINEITKNLEKLAEEDPILKELTIDDNGRIRLEKVYKRMAMFEPEERTRKIVAAFSKVMKASYSCMQESFGNKKTNKLLIDAISSSLKRYPKLLNYGLLESLSSEMKLPPQYQILKPGSYFIEAPEPAQAFKIFEQSIDLGMPALCVSSTYPSNLKKLYKLGDAKVVWLSKQEVKDAISPAELDILRDTMVKFVENRRGVVLFDGLEYLVTENGFDQVWKFLRDVIESVAVNRATLLVSINPKAFDERQLAMLERSMEVIEEE